MSNDQPNIVVGIGASAGGLEALQELFHHVPSDIGVTFIVIQHLDPDRTSYMPEILSRDTAMPVQAAEHGMRLKRSCVYMIPPNQILEVKNGKFVNHKPRSSAERQTRIDTVFMALATEYHHNAIGIILSGMGSDGTIGLKHIKELEGMTMVQKPETTRFDSMPRSAIMNKVVDFIFELKDMPGKIIQYRDYIDNNREGKFSEEHLTKEIENQMARIFDSLQRRTGHDFKDYKKSTIYRRIRRRMQIHQINDLTGYVKRLQKDPQEVQELFKDLLIGVTHFFRDNESWAILGKTVLPQILKQAIDQDKDHPCIRIWVPGCSSGEEAYTIAIIIQEYIDATGQNFGVKIFATDIDMELLEIARKGLYPEGIAEYVSAERLERFFVKEGSMYRIRKEVRERCIFSEHSLLNNPPFSRMHLISCRNLMIYFEAALQKQILPLFHYALRDNGYLFLGTSENVSAAADLFRVVDKSNRIFQAKEGLSSRMMNIQQTAFSGISLDHLDTAVRRERTKARQEEKNQLKVVLERAILDKYAAAGCVTNEHGDIIFVVGPISKFVDIPAGEPRLNIIEMAHKNFRLSLRSGLQKAGVNHQEVSKDIDHKIKDRWERIRVIIRPLSEVGQLGDFFLVIFQEFLPGGKTENIPKREGQDKESQEIINLLEKELKNTREYLDSTIEELEAANEELKSSNEELMSTNEEMQSSNEELQTSQEELQSMNEELQTVNSELNKKVEELDASHSDLQNLYESSQLAILFLDNNLRIKGFTPFLQDMFSVIETDVGRPITDIAARFTNHDFSSEAKSVLRTLERKLVEVRKPDLNEWYLMQITPYRTIDNRIDGLTVSFVDITRQKKDQEQIKTLNERLENRVNELETIFDLVPVGLVVSYDNECRKIWVNKTGSDILGTQEKKNISRKGSEPLYRLFNDEGELAPDQHPMQKAVVTGQPVHVQDLKVLRKDGTEVYIQKSAMPLFDHEQKVRGVIGTFADVTSLRRAQIDLKKFNEELEQRVNERSAESSRRAEQLRALAAQLFRVEQEERRKLSKILHDHLQQLLVAAKVALTKFEKSDKVDKVLELLDESIHSAKTLTVQLSPPLVFEQGVGGAFKWLCRWAKEELQLDVRFELKGRDEPCRDDIGFFLFNATKELLFNVFKHAGVPKAQITAQIGPKGIFLEVADHGKGIAGPLKQDNNKGFGLFSVKERVEISGGVFNIESKDGQGTKITLFFPREVWGRQRKERRHSPDVVPAKQHRRNGTSASLSGTIKVMTVDDHRLFRDGLATMINDQHNMTVVAEARNGEQALKMADKVFPDVILMDISLPDISGIEVTKQLRRQYPDVFIIGLSMHDKEDMAQLMLDAGAVTYITKSEASDKLIDAINKACASTKK